ncbi:MAG: TIGR04211 family SH3 domain-containing protein [Candidatus Polarisedimenticolaceae bacterium]|nr:TIGR04211 family SH3 domain-containing protein [Candidatus Polarisedimenticolaceae bacterium]
MQTSPFIVGLLLLILASPLSAAYITDKLLAGVYEKPESSASPLQVLQSGTPVELLETEGEFARIRLPNRSEGWVERRFISEEKPAQVMLLELQAKAGELRRKLQQAQAALEQSKKISPDPTPTGEKLAEAQQQINRLTQALYESEARLAEQQHLSALPLWLLPAAGLLLLLGFISGIIFRNYRLRKRLGGLRL